MSIAVIWASPNTDGLTAAAKESILAGLRDAGGEAVEIHLNKRDIKLCLACGNGYGACKEHGTCILKDDFADIYRQLTEAEGIVWVTPVYWHDLAECLKTFMDRLRRCETAHNHFLADKPNLIVACAGGTGLGAVQCLDRMEQTLRHMRMPVVDRLPVIRFNRDYMIPALSGAGRAFALHLLKA